jgi:hypothetical protein
MRRPSYLLWRDIDRNRLASPSEGSTRMTADEQPLDATPAMSSSPGPAVRAIAAGNDRVAFLAGPRGSAAAELLPAVDEIIEWHAPWVDFDSPELTADHVESLVKQLRDMRPERVYIFTSFHQSPLPLALICRMAGVPWGRRDL